MFDVVYRVAIRLVHLVTLQEVRAKQANIAKREAELQAHHGASGSTRVNGGSRLPSSVISDSAEAQQEEQKKREEARKNYPQPATWLKIAKLC